jgi:hypothetical protein
MHGMENVTFLHLQQGWIIKYYLITGVEKIVYVIEDLGKIFVLETSNLEC